MNFKLLLVCIFAGVGGLVSTAAAFGGDGSQGAEKSASTLKKGMTAEDVLATFGEPAEVRPMESPEGRAETWKYRRLYRRHTTQVATGVEDVPAFVGDGRDLGTTMELTHSMQTVTIYQVTSLLMFNGKVLTAKQWLERSASPYQ